MRISIAIPVFQPDTRLLRAALASLVRQSRPPDEVVMSMSGDIDASVSELADEYTTHLPLSVHDVGEAVGMVDNWASAVESTSGTSVLLLGQDDKLSSRALELLSRPLEANSRIGASAGGREIVDRAGRRVPRRRFNDRGNLFYANRCQLLEGWMVQYLMLRNGNCIAEPSALMFRRSTYDEIGGFSSDYKQIVDLDFIWRIADRQLIAYQPNIMLLRRRHGSNATDWNLRSGVLVTERTIFLVDHYNSLPHSLRGRVLSAHIVYAIYDLLRARSQTTREDVFSRLKWIVSQAEIDRKDAWSLVRDLLRFGSSDAEFVANPFKLPQ